MAAHHQVDSVRPRIVRGVGSFLFALVVALAACTSGAAPASPASPSAPAPTGSPSATSTPGSPGASAPADAFPLTVTDDEGTAVTLDAEPERIVSLSPATTEILFELGVGDRIVARVEDVALFPPEAADIPEVARYGEVDIEAIVGAEPDLVIAGGNSFTPPQAIERLRDLGLPVLVVYAPDVEAVFADMELTGTAVGRAAEAEALADDVRATFDAVATATADIERPRVFYEIDATGAIYGPADESFLAEMIELAGAVPITTGSADRFEIPLERLIEQDPEVIVLGDGGYGVTKEQVAARPGWDVITAVRAGAIRPADDILITRPGPRIGDGLRSLALAIHPDLDLGGS